VDEGFAGNVVHRSKSVGEEIKTQENPNATASGTNPGPAVPGELRSGKTGK
jgi:hypothetical protein